MAGQRNAIDGRIVEIVAELDRDELCGATGARSVAALVAWKLGSSAANAHTITTVARRLAEFPRCAQGMREGRLSLDQVGVIAARAGEGSDEHYAELARCATVNQLRTAVKLEPRPEPDSRPQPQRSITKTSSDEFTCWRINLPALDAAKFDAALASHRDALIAEWKHDRSNGACASDIAPPLPGTVEAFMRLVEAGWDAEAARRPHGHHTTVVVHVDVEQRAAALHLGPLLTEAESQYLTCDATCEVWFERAGRGHRRRPSKPSHQPAASPRARAPPVHAARFPAVGPPAVCTPTTSGTGKTAAPPSWPTWCWYARITTGCTTEASSPSPEPQIISPSPTAPGDRLTQDRSRGRPTFPRPPSRRVPGPPASAPTGGGTNPFSRSHHQQTTRLGLWFCRQDARNPNMRCLSVLACWSTPIVAVESNVRISLHHRMTGVRRNQVSVVSCSSTN